MTKRFLGRNLDIWSSFRKKEEQLSLIVSHEVYAEYLRGFLIKATDTPVLDFWWHIVWVSKPELAALFAFGGGINATLSMRLTSGATLADLLVASMTCEPFSSTYLRAGIGGARNRDLSCCRRVDGVGYEICRSMKDVHNSICFMEVGVDKCRRGNSLKDSRWRTIILVCFFFISEV